MLENDLIRLILIALEFGLGLLILYLLWRYIIAELIDEDD